MSIFKDYLKTDYCDESSQLKDFEKLKKVLDTKMELCTKPIKKLVEENIKSKTNSQSSDAKSFWKFIDIYILYCEKYKLIYNFEKIIFPKFTENSFFALQKKFIKPITSLESKSSNHKREKITFDKEVRFADCKFTEDADICYFVFKEKVNFNYAVFEKKLFIAHSTFQKDAWFRETKFQDDVDFHSSSFKTSVTFNTIVFNKSVKMIKTTFNDVTWSNLSFADAKRIVAQREGFSKLKSACFKSGDNLSSDIFFAMENDKYLEDTLPTWLTKPISFNTTGIFKMVLNINNYKTISNIFQALPIILSKWISNYGLNWWRPLIWLFILTFSLTFFLTPNIDYKITQKTPLFSVEKHITINDTPKETTSVNKESKNILDANFQEISGYKLKDTFWNDILFLVNSAFTYFGISLFIAITVKAFVIRTLYALLFYIFIGSFILAIQKRVMKKEQ